MFEDFFKNVESSIRNKMAERFGLSENETQQSTNIIIEQLRLLALDTLRKGNFQELAASISSNMDSNPLFQKLNATIVPDLISKVGLSQEMAQNIKEFSLKELINAMKIEFTDENGKVDISKIISKLNINGMNGAQNLMNTFNKIFK
jgi:hypothetical protein